METTIIITVSEYRALLRRALALELILAEEDSYDMGKMAERFVGMVKEDKENAGA